MKKPPDAPGICSRIEQLRRELHGSRGKARFCKQLGISPSTYNYYEAARVPPADLLVKIADLAGADLRWLLTGQTAEPAVPADHPAVVRVAALLTEHPEAAVPLTAFVETLAETMKWPKKKAFAAGASVAPTGRPRPPRRRQRPRPVSKAAAADTARREWIPILGRSAAGVPHFWANAEDGRGVTVLAELIDRYAGHEPGQFRPAVAADETDDSEGAAQLITLTEPDEANVAEFVAAAALKHKYADAFAVRIDGNSMAPDPSPRGHRTDRRRTCLTGTAARRPGRWACP